MLENSEKVGCAAPKEEIKHFEIGPKSQIPWKILGDIIMVNRDSIIYQAAKSVENYKTSFLR